VEAREAVPEATFSFLLFITLQPRVEEHKIYEL
jgi:hypothetical protein